MLRLLPKKHQFDLDHPVVVETCGHEWTKYRCTRCGTTLGLNRNQMEHLPRSMAYGCRGSRVGGPQR